MPVKKSFTPDEAQSLLPKVRRLLARMHVLKAQINFLAEQKEAPVQLTEPFSEDEIYRFAFAQEIKLNRELHRHTYEFFKTLDQLNGLGCIVKDLDAGLVDFPARINSRKVLLCWKEGEERITHWHELNAGVFSGTEKCPADALNQRGFAGRKPLIDLDDAQ